MLKRAFSKLKLEHVVIGKGQFQFEKAKLNAKETLEVCFIDFSNYIVVIALVLC